MSKIAYEEIERLSEHLGRLIDERDELEETYLTSNGWAESSPGRWKLDDLIFPEMYAINCQRLLDKARKDKDDT